MSLLLVMVLLILMITVFNMHAMLITVISHLGMATM
jgi:hypothetical protein